MSVDMDTPLMELNRELMALRRMQLIVNSSPTSSMADKRRISERVMQLAENHGLLPESEEDTTASPMF